MFQLFPNVVIFDDASRLCKIIPYKNLQHDKRQSDPAFAQIVNRAGRALVSVTGNCFLSTLILIFGGIITHAFLPNWPIWLAYALWIIPLLPFARYIAIQDQQQSAKHTVIILLANGLCPGCSYNLGTQPEVHGLVLCPKCGASWHETRITHRHTFTATPETVADVVRRWYRQLGNVDTSGPTTIQDDQETVRPIVHSRLAQLIYHANGDQRARLIAARHEIRQQGSIIRIITALFFLIVMGSAFLATWISETDTSMIFILIGILISLAFAMFLASGSLFGGYGTTADHIRKVMLRHRLCPSCAGDLDDTAKQSTTGCTICPTCGAAWHIKNELHPDTGLD